MKFPNLFCSLEAGFDTETSQYLACYLEKNAGNAAKLHEWMSNYVYGQLNDWLTEYPKNPSWAENENLGQNFDAETNYEDKGERIRQFKTEEIVDLDDPNLHDKVRTLVHKTAPGASSIVFSLNSIEQFCVTLKLFKNCSL